MRTLLTIITPVYNGEKFIESCLLSVIRQHCPRVEHLIIDGGSSDSTVDLIKRYAKLYPHIRWTSERDNGQSAAMNKGIAMAQGEIIGILNSDDYYEPGVFIRILKIFEKSSNPSFVVGNCNVLNDEEKLIYLNKPDRVSLINILIEGKRNQFPHNPSSYFYHKSLHNKIGLYDESEHYTMDLDFLLRALPVSHIRYVNETWGNFRRIRGTKTFQSVENNELEKHKKRVMEIYFKKLPLFQQWWIKAMRYVFVKRIPHYYGSRIVDCIKNPKEISAIISKKLNPHGIPQQPSILIWEDCASCPIKRTEGNLVQIGHKIFLIGGFYELDCVLNDVQVLDLKQGTWTSSFKMPPQMPQTHMGTISDGQRYIYCVAGQKGPQCHPAVRDCFVLDTQQQVWSDFPPLPEIRYAPTVQLWHGRLHVLGGSKEDRNTPATDHWSIAVNQGKALENKWRKEKPIPKGGPHRASAIIQDKFYVFGGEKGDVKPIKGDPSFTCDWNTPLERIYGDTFVLEIGARSWKKKATMPRPTTHAEACILINNRFVMLVGGNRQRGILSDALQIYDANTNTWQVINRLPYPMKTAAAYWDGWLYLITGQRSMSSADLRPGEVLNNVWRAKFTP